MSSTRPADAIESERIHPVNLHTLRRLGKPRGKPPVHRDPGSIRRGLFVAIVLVIQCVSAWAQTSISGLVIDHVSSEPISGVRIQVVGKPETAVFTDSQGRFLLQGLIGTSVDIGAALPYDAARPLNYETTAVSAKVGSEVGIQLLRAPGGASLLYQPAPSSACSGCHKEQHEDWAGSNHARAAQNVRVRDLYSGDGTLGNPYSAHGYVFTQTHSADNSGLCATCHSPNEQPLDPAAVRYNEVTTTAGMEGVTCTSCHQLHVVNDQTDSIHLLGNAEFFLPEAGSEDRHVFGPLPDVGTNKMKPFYSTVFSDSRLCASCHEYVSPGTGAPGQETYSEWLASPAAASGVTCQACHMPAALESGTVASGGVTRPPIQRRDHSFAGVFSGILSDPVSLELFIGEINSETVSVRSEVTSLMLGHRWPTGVDPRNALLVVEAFLNGEPLAFSSGDVVPFWGSASPEVSPGQGDYAGRAGRGYAKVLEGRIGGQGELVRPVNFIDAEGLYSKTTLLPGETDVGNYTFSLPSDIPLNSEIEVRGRVLYRRIWRDWAVAKGWTEIAMDEPWERLVAEQTMNQVVEGQSSYTVTSAAGPGGTIAPASQVVEEGSTATMTITADEGYSIDAVTGCGGTLNAGTYTTAVVTTDCQVSATFAVNRYPVAVAVSPTEGGTWSGGGEYDFGTEVTVTATPASGYTFVNWTEDQSLVSTASSYVFTMPATARNLTATFSQNTHTVTATTGPGGTIAPASQVVEEGSTATMTITADEGYSIDAVTGCGGTLNAGIYTTAAITVDCEVSATFRLMPTEAVVFSNGFEDS